MAYRRRFHIVLAADAYGINRRCSCQIALKSDALRISHPDALAIDSGRHRCANRSGVSSSTAWRRMRGVSMGAFGCRIEVEFHGVPRSGQRRDLSNCGQSLLWTADVGLRAVSMYEKPFGGRYWFNCSCRLQIACTESPAATCLVLMTILFLVETVIVLLRYVFGIGFLELQDIVSYSFAALVVLGLPVTLRLDKHVRVDVFGNSSRTRTTRLFDAIGICALLIPVSDDTLFCHAGHSLRLEYPRGLGRNRWTSGIFCHQDGAAAELCDDDAAGHRNDARCKTTRRPRWRDQQ